MWILWDLFDDVVDITTAPLIVGAKIIDKTLYPFDDSITFFNDGVKTLQNTLKNK